MCIEPDGGPAGARVFADGDIGTGIREFFMSRRAVVETLRVGARLSQFQQAVAVKPIGVGYDGQQFESELTEVASPAGEELAVGHAEYSAQR